MKILKILKNKIVDTYYFGNLLWQVVVKWNKERYCPTCGAKTHAGKIHLADVTLTSGKIVPIEMVVRGCPSNCAHHMERQTIDLEGENLTIDEFLYVAEKVDKRKALWYFVDLFKQSRRPTQPN